MTVLVTTGQNDLAAEYGVKRLGRCPCPAEEEGACADCVEFDGLCDEVRKAMYQYVFALAHGVIVFPFPIGSARKALRSVPATADFAGHLQTEGD